MPEIESPVERDGVESAWHIYAIRLRLEHLTIDRARFIEELASAKIGTSVHFIPVHIHPYYGTSMVSDRRTFRLPGRAISGLSACLFTRD